MSAESPVPPATSPIESVDRALQVLTVLAAGGPRGLVLADLATRLGIHKTTVHRTLAALRFREFVTQDPQTGAYALGGAAVALGEAYLSVENLQVLLHPALVALSRDVDELVHLGVLTGNQVLYLDKVEPDRPVRVWSEVGRRSSALTTALGRAMLAYRGAGTDALAGYGDAVDGRVREQVALARTTGRAIEDQENEPGIACVAVPVLRGGAPVAAVSITVPVERFDPRRVDDLHARMRAVLPTFLPQGLRIPEPSPA